MLDGLLIPAGPDNQRDRELFPALQAAELPAYPEGWLVGPPDFVGVGAQRSGTTWWHGLITTHPGVCFERGTHVKEVHFFDTLGDRDALSSEDAERYHRHFPRPRGSQLVGEWTPRYMQDPWVPGQLAQAAPGARVLVLLRDPVDRFASGFARARRMAAERGLTGIDAELTTRHVELGMYYEQVRRVLETFDRDRVLILQYERCRERYDEELRRTYEFVGLDPDRGADAVPPREPRERPLPAAERARLAELFAPDVRRLSELVPDLDVALWQSVAKLA
jgi:hypothetical protein